MTGEKDAEPKGRGVGRAQVAKGPGGHPGDSAPGAVGATESFHAGERCSVVCMLKSTLAAVWKQEDKLMERKIGRIQVFLNF